MSRKLVGDTAAGLDERLGAEYGDYARKAATAIDDVANSLASKDADELIDDTRNFVRKSPGVALAGAAIVGFALARLVKSGLRTTATTAPSATRTMLKPPKSLAEPEDERPLGELVPAAGRGRQGLCQGRSRRCQGDRRSAKAARSRLPAILLFAAFLFAQAAVTVLAVAIALAWRR